MQLDAMLSSYASLGLLRLLVAPRALAFQIPYRLDTDVADTGAVNTTTHHGAKTAGSEVQPAGAPCVICDLSPN